MVIQYEMRGAKTYPPIQVYAIISSDMTCYYGTKLKQT
jgi:hypothetical protein